MSCHICAREFSSRRRPHCNSCARAILYTPRIEQAAALLSREKAHIHIEAIVRPGNDGVLAALPADADWEAISTGVKRHGVERAKAEQEVTEDRIRVITRKAQEMKEQIESYKTWMAKQKESHARRKEELATQHKELQRHKSRAADPVQLAIKTERKALEKAQRKIVNARSVLCRETALLDGLRKSKGKDGRSVYWLGAVAIPDLRRLNVKNAADNTSTGKESRTPKAHEEISAALGNIARLLASCCHYLGVRLPAEIALPHAGFAYAAILPERSSYQARESSSSNVYLSASMSRIVERGGAPKSSFLHRERPATSEKSSKNSDTPKYRILHLDRPLAQLLKEDAKAFHMFVEAVTLLAWDVIWLCKMQGIENLNSFDDVCAIGRNLYQLALRMERTPQRSTPTYSTGSPVTGKEPPNNQAAPISLGLFTHSSAQYALHGSAGLDLAKNWKLASSAPLIDKLKSYLMNEISGAEWDIVEGDEWDEEQDHERPVLVGGPKRLEKKEMHMTERGDPSMSVMSVAQHDGTEEKQPITEKSRASNGWTKVRGRG